MKNNILVNDGSEADLGLALQKKLRNQIIEICKPIADLFNVTFFSHTRAFHNGSFTSLMTHPELTEYYIKNKFPIRFSQGKCLALENGFYIGSCLHDINDAVTNDLRENFKVDHFIYVIEKQVGFDDMYAFATHTDNNKFINQYINNIELFKKFLHYYKNKSHSLIKNTQIVRYGEEFFLNSNNKVIDSTYIELNQIEKCSQHLNLKKWVLQTESGEICLSKREGECLRLLTKNHTIKEMAKLLALSPRTIETYLNNLKFKLKCDKRSQLVDFFHRFCE